MGKISSEQFFHKKPENLNCAQSVLKGFQEDFQISRKIIDDFRAFGGGRAENGVCGALYAANYLMTKNGKQVLDDLFRKKIHAIRCDEIKKDKKHSCIECVKTADELIREML